MFISSDGTVAVDILPEKTTLTATYYIKTWRCEHASFCVEFSMRRIKMFIYSFFPKSSNPRVTLAPDDGNQ